MMYPFLKKIVNLYIKYRLKFKIKYKYRIIPIGSYCMPRVITTFSLIKPRKKNGELSGPFDLAFFNDFDKIIECIDTKFANFYDGLFYNNETKYWENNKLNAVYNHDGLLKQSEFINKYNKRIENFENYIKDEKSFKFFILASFQEIQTQQIAHCVEVLNKVVQSDNYKLVIINQSKKTISYASEKVQIINQNHNIEKFNRINKSGNWCGELYKCKKRDAYKIYKEISLAILDIICNVHI